MQLCKAASAGEICEVLSTQETLTLIICFKKIYRGGIYLENPLR